MSENERPLKRRKMEEEKIEEKENEKQQQQQQQKPKKQVQLQLQPQQQQQKQQQQHTQTISITYGDQAENHVGMQMIGQLSKEGFTPLDLKNAQKIFEKMGGKAELIDLREKSGKKEIREKAEEACVLVLRRGVDVLLGGRRGEGEGKGEGEGEGEKGKEKEEEEEKEKKKGKGKTADDFFEEQVKLDADKKAYMYGRIVNKVARYNLCFAQESQEPDYINKKGRIVGYNEVPILSSLRDSFSFLLGEKGEGLVAEGNYYYDPKKCGIGFHGDGERKKVVAVRLGSSLPLHYQWFIEGGVVGERIKLLLNHGDIYIMSEKATGNDWKKKKIFTLRHAAGCEKFLKIKGSLG